MPSPRSNLTLVTAPCDDVGSCEFWVSDPEPMEDGEGDWGFAVYMAKDVWVATFSYRTKESAEAARKAIGPVLKDAVFIATEVS